MPDVLKGNRDTLPDHGTTSGDLVIHSLVINIHASGALSIHGPLENREWVLAVLENAKDALNNYHGRRSSLIVPSKDVSIQEM